jgi:hypothetical protein
MDLSKIKTLVKSASPLEIALFILFVLYLVLPINTPPILAPLIDSPIGMVTIFAVTLYLFLYTNPILGILYIFVAYELLRRSGGSIFGADTGPSGETAYIEYSPSQEKRNSDLQEMNPVKSTSLEEDVVQKMAPVGHSDQSSYINSDFKPVTGNVHNAFSV